MDIQTLFRFLLVFTAMAMMVLAMAYLRHKSMNWSTFLLWGLLAIGVPYIGPFLVIALRAGQNNRQYETQPLKITELE